MQIQTLTFPLFNFGSWIGKIKSFHEILRIARTNEQTPWWIKLFLTWNVKFSIFRVRLVSVVNEVFLEWRETGEIEVTLVHQDPKAYKDQRVIYLFFIWYWKITVNFVWISRWSWSWWATGTSRGKWPARVPRSFWELRCKYRLTIFQIKLTQFFSILIKNLDF